MRAILAVLVLTACGDNLARPPDPGCDAWQQWGASSAHTGASCSIGQPLERVLAQVQIDPLAAEERADWYGALIVHYQVPLVDGDDVYVMQKQGFYTPCLPTTNPLLHCEQPGDLYGLDSQIWAEADYHWQDGALVPRWTFVTDWKPIPGFETMFQPALVGGVIAIPAAHGGLWELDAHTGAVLRHDLPLGDDANTYVVGALAADWGTVYYNAIRVDHDDPWGKPMRAWLVAVHGSGDTATADYATLVPGAPKADDLCYTTFTKTDGAGWPPPPNPDGTPAVPPQTPCGAQVPGLNAAPTFAYDSTIYVATHAQDNPAYSYLAAIDPSDLHPVWASSLRGRLHDGCGVAVPYEQDAPHAPVFCRDGTPRGVDPFTGMLPAAEVDDGSSGSPVALPHGGVIVGTSSGYNQDRGHLIELDDHGRFVASYDFGWDVTPAVIPYSDGDRILLKDNHYGLWGPGGPYDLTELDAQLEPIWQFQSTETESCTRQPDGTVSCVSDHPNGFEWCINAPAVDREGTMFANSEDGHLYAITADGQLRDRIFLDSAIGSAYTPLAIDHAGRIYAQQGGQMFVIGAD